MIIDSRFHDLGFGNKEVNLSSPPNNTNLLTYSNNGFGNKEFLVLNSKNYNNTRELNFGSKSTIEEDQSQYEYRHRDFFETGSVSVDKNSYSSITLKNKKMNRANLFLSSRNFINTNLYYEKESLRTFKIYNSSSRKNIVDYVASQNNTFLELLTENVISSETINDLITQSFIIVSETLPKYDENTLDNKLINALNTTPNENYVSSINIGVFHFYINHSSSTTANYELTGLSKSENSFFKFRTPEVLQDSVHLLEVNTPIFLLSDPDDDSTKTLQLYAHFFYNYRLTLESNTTYYVWYDLYEDSWYVSPDRYPNITIYS